MAVKKKESSKWLLDAMETKGIDRKQLAAMTRISHHSICAYTDKHQTIRLDHLTRICNALGFDPDEVARSLGYYPAYSKKEVTQVTKKGPIIETPKASEEPVKISVTVPIQPETPKKEPVFDPNGEHKRVFDIPKRNKKLFGAWLRKRVKELDISMSTFAKTVGITTGSIYRYSKGLSVPPVYMVKNICILFDQPVVPVLVAFQYPRYKDADFWLGKGPIKQKEMLDIRAEAEEALKAADESIIEVSENKETTTMTETIKPIGEITINDLAADDDIFTDGILETGLANVIRDQIRNADIRIEFDANTNSVRAIIKQEGVDPFVAPVEIDLGVLASTIVENYKKHIYKKFFN
jgi:transcriptional regulator with XRE-family HTH domain